MSGNPGGPAHKYLQCIDPNQIEPSEALYITALSPAAKQTLNGRTANEDTGLLLQECAVVAAALSHVMIRVMTDCCHVSRVTRHAGTRAGHYRHRISSPGRAEPGSLRVQIPSNFQPQPRHFGIIICAGGEKLPSNFKLSIKC